MTPASELVLMVSTPDTASRCYQFIGEHIRIGRDKTNHLQIDDDVLSKVHCELFRDPSTGQWFFRDLGSTNGSKLNNADIAWESVNLNEGDELILGNKIALIFARLCAMQIPETPEEEEDDPDINPVAAAMARQSRDDMEGTQLIKLKSPRRKR